MACLSCGTCTFVCPTCHCFDINDETLFRKGSAAGAVGRLHVHEFHPGSERPQSADRGFPRDCASSVNHKFSYYVKNFGITSCVGCGRCTRSCPVNIDILSVAEGAIKESEKQ